MAHKKKLVVAILTDDRVVIDVAELSMPQDISNVIVETKIVDDDEPHLRRDRSPLSPDVLRLADLRVGIHVKVCYAGYCSEMMSREGIITGLPRRDDDSNIVIPIAIIMEGGGVHHTTLNAADMGLVRGKGGWDRYNYTLRIA